MKISVSKVREVRFETIEAREPSRSLSRRECSLDAIDESIGEPFVVVPTNDCTSAGK